MNDRTNPTVPTQAEVVEQTAEQQSAAEPAAAVSQQAEAAAEQAARQEAEARQQAEATLAAAVKAFRQGEKAYRAGLLEAGRLADEYIRQRLTLGDKRAAAVDLVTLELSRYSSTTVDVNRLVACYHGVRLLAEEQGLATAPAKGKPAPADAVPYGHYRDCWSRLIERQQKDTPAECWVLLSGLEQECRDLFGRAVKDALSKQAVEEAVAGLLREYARRQAEAARLAKEQADREAKAKAVQEAQAREDRLKAEAAARKLEEAAQQGNGVSAEQLEQAKEKLLTAQRQEVEAAAAAEQAAAEQARREREAKEAQQRQQRQLDAQRKRQQREQERKAREAAKQDAGKSTGADQGPDQGVGIVTGNLLRSAVTATPKDLAGMLLEQTRQNADPLAVLWELGNTLTADKNALDALLDGVLTALPQGKPRQLLGMALNALRGRGLTPVDLAMATGQASANGTPAGAAA